MMKSLKWVFITFAVMVAISIGLLVLRAMLFPAKVAHTAITAAGGVVDKTLSADNIIVSYEWFHDANGQFDARRGQIRAHADLVRAELDPKERSRLNIELAAMRQSCRDLAAKYNANSDKANKALFKSNALPETLSISNCEA